jgi:hypothetical protein
VANALSSELLRHGTKVDTLVRTKCRVGWAYGRVAARGTGARGGRVWLGAASAGGGGSAGGRAAELEERVRQDAAGVQAWCNIS